MSFKIGDKVRHKYSNWFGLINSIQGITCIAKHNATSSEVAFLEIDIEKYFDIGDKVNITTSYNLVTNSYNTAGTIKFLSNPPYTKNYTVEVNGGLFNIPINELDLIVQPSVQNSIPLPKNPISFNMGDRVEITDIASAFVGKIGTIIKKYLGFADYLYTVEFADLAYPIDYIATQLKLEFNPNFVSGVSGTLQKDISNSINYAINNTTLLKNNKASHSHNWKKYTGLTYQEEFCDGCNEIRNRKGLYE